MIVDCYPNNLNTFHVFIVTFYTFCSIVEHKNKILKIKLGKFLQNPVRKKLRKMNKSMPIYSSKTKSKDQRKEQVVSDTMNVMSILQHVVYRLQTFIKKTMNALKLYIRNTYLVRFLGSQNRIELIVLFNICNFIRKTTD